MPPDESSAQDARLAREAAQAAGDALLALREGFAGTESELRDAGDAAAQRILAALLGERRPEDAVLSEEAADDPARLGADRVWIIDPLDGTREYSEGRADWAVHVAIWERGSSESGRLTGAIAIPAEGLLLDSATVPPLPARAPGPLRIAVSRSRPPAIVEAVAARLGAELVPMGSAGVKIAAVIRGEVDAYLHGGGQYEWDSAAPVAVALAAGAHASRLDGSPLAYNRPDPFLPDIVVCRPEHAAELLAAIAERLAGAAAADTGAA